ncbi:MAG: hypothetical protein WA886_01035, partial [Candidatus Acidiferrales bacterium]
MQRPTPYKPVPRTRRVRQRAPLQLLSFSFYIASPIPAPPQICDSALREGIPMTSTQLVVLAVIVVALIVVTAIVMRNR